MKFMPGMFAASKAGHDKNRIYIVVSTADENIYVADGILKTVRHPKKKNRKHLQPILKNRICGELTDEVIRTKISNFILK